MAQFVWDPAVRWPPPAGVLLNYDVVPPVAARDIPARTDVLNPGDVVAQTTGGHRVVLNSGAPPSTDSALEERVTALEINDATQDQQITDLQDLTAAHDERLTDLEAFFNVPPVVVDETATYLTTALQVGVIIRTMQASANPTAWEITDESRNGLPTTGYWLIDQTGGVSPTQAGVAGIARHNQVEIAMRATNPYGYGDGKLDINFN